MKQNVLEDHIESGIFFLKDYFNRIGFNRAADNNIECITEMVQCQLRSIPFENLDVQAGKIISLIGNDIVDKIINHKRGGYCYEVNGLFALALQAMGIPYIFVAARPMFYPVKRPKTHMAIIATIDDEQYLIDLGFGSYGITEPINLNTAGSLVKQGIDTFRLLKTGEHQYLLQALVEKDWANQYSFEAQHQEWIDFAPANYLNSTHPDAIFVQKPLIILHTIDGRKVLFGNSFKLIKENYSETISFEDHEYAGILLKEFNLVKPLSI